MLNENINEAVDLVNEMIRYLTPIIDELSGKYSKICSDLANAAENNSSSFGTYASNCMRHKAHRKRRIMKHSHH